MSLRRRRRSIRIEIKHFIQKRRIGALTSDSVRQITKRGKFLESKKKKKKKKGKTTTNFDESIS